MIDQNDTASPAPADTATEPTVTDDTAADLGATSTDDDGPDDDDGPATDAAPSRKERLRMRFDQLRSGFEQTQRELERERKAREASEAEARRFREDYYARQQQQQPDPAKQLNEQAEAIEREMERELALAAEGKSDMRRYWQLQRQQSELIADQRARQIVSEMMRQQPDPGLSATRQALEEKHPWLATNTEARAAADGYLRVLMAKRRVAQPSMALYNEACALAAKDFELGGDTAPSAASKARYAGVPSKEGASSSAPAEAPASEDDLAIARAWANYYPKLSGAADEVVYRAWKKKVAKR